jgi:hypothetical protein
MQRIIDIIVLETAEENIAANTAPDMVGQLWGLVWRIRSADVIIRGRTVLETALL